MTPTLVKQAPALKSIRRRWRGATNQTAVLAIILASYLMIVLDVSVVIAALPKIHSLTSRRPASRGCRAPTP